MPQRQPPINVVLAAFLLAFSSLASIHAEALKPGQVVTWAGAQHAFMGSVAEQTYRIDLKFDGKNNPKTEFALAFGAADEKNYYRLLLNTSQMRLQSVKAGKAVEIRTVIKKFNLQGGHRLLIIRSDGWLGIVLDKELVLHALHADYGGGKMFIRADANSPGMTGLRTQPTAAINFADNFMRTAEMPDPWESVKGQWQLHTVARPNVKYSNDRIPDPTRSPNYFFYQGKPEGHALAVAGYPFWTDYSFTAAIKVPQSTTGQSNRIGMVFYRQDSSNYYLLKWSLKTFFLSASKLELIRVLDGKPQTIAETAIPGQTDQWYLAEVSVLGKRIRAFIDRRKIFDVEDSYAIGGKVGLYSEGSLAGYFDDIAVLSTQEFEFYKKDGTPDPANIQTVNQANSSFQFFGAPAWGSYLVTATAKAGQSEAIGIGARFSDLNNGLLFRWNARGPAAGKMQLLQILKGKQTVLAEAAEKVQTARSYELKLNLTEPGIARLYVDGTLKLRAAVSAPASGRGAMFAAGKGAEFFRPVLAFTEEIVAEQPVANRIFVSDPFMQGWSNPRWIWLPEGKTQPAELKDPLPILWHKGDFFGAAKFKIACAATGSIHLFMPEKKLGTGYALHLEQPASGMLGFKLDRQGKTVAQAQVKAADCPIVKMDASGAVKHPQVEFNRDGHYFWLKVGNQQILSYRDSQPLTGSICAIHRPTGKGLNSEHVETERTKVFEEQFTQAPSSWTKLGTWQMTNRFQCDPRWSHYAGLSKQVAAIWNKYEYDGDLTVEYHAGMKHGRAYTRPGDINLTICGDGHTPSSGYSFIITGWDAGWNGMYSRIMRGNQVVAQTDTELVPRVRLHAAKRHFQGLWNPSGRDVHGAWHYIKVRKIGGHIECYFENKLIMTYDDPKPLTGKRVALWTQDNEIVLAKIKLAYSGKRSVPASPAPVFQSQSRSVGFPPLRLWSPDRESLRWDFEYGLEGWKALDGRHGALLNLETENPGPEGRQSLKIVNPHAGGTFALQVPRGGVNLLDCSDFAFDYRLQSGVAVNIFFTINKKKYFIEFTGNPRSDMLTTSLGKFEGVVADGRWRRASFPIAKAVRRMFPTSEAVRPEAIVIGNLEEGYLRAGIGGNQSGATYWLDNFQFLTTGQSGTLSLHWQPQSSSGSVPSDSSKYRYSYSVDRNADTDPDISKPTAPTRTAITVEGDGRWFFHIRSQNSSGKWSRTVHYPFTVHSAPPRVVGITPANKAKWSGQPIVIQLENAEPFRFDTLRTSLAVNGSSFNIRSALTNFDWDAQQLTLDLSSLEIPKNRKLEFALNIGRRPAFLAHWFYLGPFENVDDKGFDKVFEPEKDAGKIDLSKTYKGLNGSTVSWKPIQIDDNNRASIHTLIPGKDMVAYFVSWYTAPADEENAKFAYGCDDGGKIWVNGALRSSEHIHWLLSPDKYRLESSIRKGLNEIFAKVDQGYGEWELIFRRSPETQKHQWSYRYSSWKDELPPTNLTVKGGPMQFDFESGLTAPFVYQGGYPLIDEETAASGKRSLKIFNPSVNATFAIDLVVPNLFPFNAGRYPVMEFDYKIPPHVQVDIGFSSNSIFHPVRLSDRDKNYIRRASIVDFKGDDQWRHAETNLKLMLDAYPYHQNKYQVARIRFGDWGYRGNGPRVTYNLDNVQLIPALSSEVGTELELAALDPSGIRGYAFLWSAYPDDDPGTKIKSRAGKISVKQLPEGDQYLHVRVCDKKKNWTEPQHFRFIVDNIPPVVSEAQISDTVLKFNASDDRSGVDPESLKIKIDGVELLLNSVVTIDKLPAEQSAESTTAESGREVPPPTKTQFEWDWALARGPVDKPIADGTKIAFEIAPVTDFVGNQTGASKVEWTLEYTKDKTPPPAPEISMVPMPASPPPPAEMAETKTTAAAAPKLMEKQVFNSVTTSLGEMASLSDIGGIQVERLWDPKKNDYVLQVTNMTLGSMGLRLHETDFDAAQFPIVSFDYRLPTDGYKFAFHFIAYVNSTWKVLELHLPLAVWRNYVKLRQVTTAVRDGNWHTATFNLYQLLKEKMPGQEKFVVQRLAIVDWYGARVPSGNRYFIDNFSLSRQGGVDVEFEFHSPDASGTRGFSYELNRLPNATPDEKSDGLTPRAKFSSLTPGLWYFHVRAQDGAGNWGAPSHFPHFATASLQEGRRLRLLGILGNTPQLLKLNKSLKRLAVNGTFYENAPLTSLRKIELEGSHNFARFELLQRVSAVPARKHLHPLGKDGKPINDATLTVCPTDEKYIAERLNALRQFLKVNDVSGVWLQSIQFPAKFLSTKPNLSESCFDPSTLARFQKDTGIKIAGKNVAEQANWILANKKKEWAHWKCKVVTSLVTRAKQVIQEERPGALVGMFTCAWSEKEQGGAVRTIVGHDLVQLGSVVDILSPLTLHRDLGKSADWPAHRFKELAAQLKTANASAWLWPVIEGQAWKTAKPQISAEELAIAITRTIEAGADGIFVDFATHSRQPDADKLAVIEAVYSEFWRLGQPKPSTTSPVLKELAPAEKLLKAGKPEQAAALITKAVQMNTHHSKAWSLLGRAHAAAGRSQQAIAATRRAIFEAPLDSVPWDQLGRVFKKEKRYADAIHSFKLALSHNPALSSSSYSLAATLILHGQVALAIPHLESACKYNPKLRKTWQADPEFKPAWQDLRFARLK